jgi:predicted ester cyclase
MSEERNKEIFRRVIEEGYTKGNLETLNELFSPSFIEHQNGIQPPNLVGLKDFVRSLRSGFPDLHLTIEDLRASGDYTIARITARGTHNGQFMIFPPTGTSVTIDVIDIFRFQNGIIAEHWGVADRFSLMQQLGVIPGR